MSTEYLAGVASFSAAMVHDGKMNTQCLSGRGATPSWLTVKLPSNTKSVGYVVVRNRQDGFSYMLGEFEIWLGHDFGDTAYQCGGTLIGNSIFHIAVDCNGQTGYEYVTLKQKLSGKYITIAELEVYAAV